LLEPEVDEPSSGKYGVKDSLVRIIFDCTTRVVLWDFASDQALIDAVKVREEEWQALASIQAPGRIDKDVYVQLLMTIRTVSRT
jgi:hypothetical protein